MANGLQCFCCTYISYLLYLSSYQNTLKRHMFSNSTSKKEQRRSRPESSWETRKNGVLRYFRTWHRLVSTLISLWYYISNMATFNRRCYHDTNILKHGHGFPTKYGYWQIHWMHWKNLTFNMVTKIPNLHIYQIRNICGKFNRHHNHSTTNNNTNQHF
jgi:hypothetical protein